MIRARLIPRGIKPDMSVIAYKNLIKEGRSTIARERLLSRKRAHSYARFARRRGFNAGYTQGLAAVKDDFMKATGSLRQCYSTIVDTARRDTEELARGIAERLIEMSALENPRILEEWIKESLEILKGSRPLLLTYHPRYERIMTILSTALPDGILIQVDAHLQEVDFAIQGASGGIEFSWRAAIADSAPQTISAVLDRG